MNRPTDLITPRVAAKEIGLSTDSLYRRIHDGTLRCWRIGSRFRVSRADVQNLFEPYQPEDQEPLVTRADRDRQLAAADATLRAVGAI